MQWPMTECPANGQLPFPIVHSLRSRLPCYPHLQAQSASLRHWHQPNPTYPRRASCSNGSTLPVHVPTVLLLVFPVLPAVASRGRCSSDRTHNSLVNTTPFHTRTQSDFPFLSVTSTFGSCFSPCLRTAHCCGALTIPPRRMRTHCLMHRALCIALFVLLPGC